MRSDKSKKYIESIRFYSHGTQNNSSKIPILIHLRNSMHANTKKTRIIEKKNNTHKTTRKYTHSQW